MGILLPTIRVPGIHFWPKSRKVKTDSVKSDLAGASISALGQEQTFFGVVNGVRFTPESRRLEGCRLMPFLAKSGHGLNRRKLVCGWRGHRRPAFQQVGAGFL